MSTTKLPEAFEPMDNQQRRDRFANGYNACLEATGAKELWEALDAMVQSFSGLETLHPAVFRIARAALAKSNPSNTVG